jgi:hypothetical protein
MKINRNLIILLSSIIILSIIFTPVEAYNYDPGIETGDEIVWIIKHNDVFQNYVMNEIAVIGDYGSETKIFGYVSEATNGNFVTYIEEQQLLSILGDYTENPDYFFDWAFIPNGTQIADYIDIFEANEILGSGATYESIYTGYGINCTTSEGEIYVLRFSTRGILSYRETNSGSSKHVVELDSINGVPYHQIGIKSTVIITSFLTTVIIIIFFRRIRLKITR